MQDLSVQELKGLYARLVGPHPQYAFTEAKDRMKEVVGYVYGRDSIEDILVVLSLRLEIVEAVQTGKEEA